MSEPSPEQVMLHVIFDCMMECFFEMAGSSGISTDSVNDKWERYGKALGAAGKGVPMKRVYKALEDGDD